MKDPSRSDQKRIGEISGLKQRIQELEQLESKRKLAEEALQLSRERLDDAQRIAKIGNWEADLFNGELYWSQAIFDIFGLDSKSFKPSVKAFYEAVHPDDRDLVFESEKRSEQTGLQDVVHRIMRPSGEVRIVHELARRYTDEKGKLIMLRGTVQDITERKRAEETLRENEERYRTLVENASDIVFRLDNTGHITFVNPAALRIMGYEEKEIIGRHYPTFIRSDMQEEAMKFFGRQFVKGIPKTYSEYPVIVKNGREIWLGQNTQLIFQDGKMVAFQAVARDITERKWAEEELRRNQDVAEQLAQEITIIAEIGKVIGSTLDIDEVYERFAAEVKKLIPFDRLAVNLHSLHEENVRVAYTSGEKVPGRCKGDLFPLKGSTCEVLTKTRAGLYSHPKDVEEMNHPKSNPFASVKAGMRSLLRVPLIYRDEVIGSLHFGMKTPDSYTGRDLRLAERIGIQIAGAIGSAKLFSDRKQLEEENERRSKQMAALHDIGIELTAEFNLEALFQAIAHRSLELIGGDTSNVYIYRSEEDLMERIVSVGQTLIPSKTTRRRGEGMVGQTWEKGGPMLINDYHSWPGRTKTIDSYPSRALIAVPFRQGTEIIGVINIMANLPHQYTQADVDMLDLFATQAAIAIRNAQLYDRIKLELVERKQAEEKERRNREAAERLAGEMELIAKIGRLISSTLDINEVYERFAAETRKLISFDKLAVNLHRLHEENIRVAYTFGEDVPGRRLGDIFSLKNSVSEVLTKTMAGLLKHPGNTEDMHKQFPDHVATVKAGMRSLMGVPLIYRDEVIGSLHFRSKTPNAYTEKDLRLAERIGMQIAGAIANAQLYADLKKTEQELKESEQRYRELSIIDDLTQLYNSRHFYFQLKIELDRSNRYGHPLTLLLLDLDNFKHFNDTYGHVEGDQVLMRLGQVVKRCLRETDFAYRYGGEEFTIVLPMTTSADGAVTAERIRTEFKNETFFPAPGQDVHKTVSIGLAQYRPREEMKAFVHRVDQLMYQGKKNGKDRVCCE